MPLAAGRRLGPYEIIEPIGAGGMGEVYRARDTRLQRYVAIKIVPSAVAGDPSALARFEREAQAVAALSHPNILAIHDFGHDNGVSYAVMELLEGRSLAEVIQSGPVPIRKALDYSTQIVKGLAAAHERGIVHRDLKPANLFVNSDGRVTILDFGLARLDQPPSTHTAETTAPGTSPGMVLGTVGYMAPEQVRGQAVDHRTDIFAFGAVLYEMLSGRRAFAGATAADTMSAILSSDPPELDLDGSSSAPALDRIIRHCLEKEPAQRFQSTRDLAFALDALSTRSAAGAAAAATEATASSRRRRGWLPIATASLLLGAGGTWLASTAWRPRAGSAATPASPVVRFEMQVGPQNIPSVSVSPDGQSLAWGVAAGLNAPEFWVRRLSDVAPIKVPGVMDVFGPWWREDSRRLIALRNSTYYSIDSTSGVLTPQFTLPLEMFQRLRGVNIDHEDLLLAANDGIVRVRVGQSPTSVEVARPDKTVHDWYAGPTWLPDRSRILFMASRRDHTTLEAMVQPMDGSAPVRLPLPEGISRVLVDHAGAIVYGLNGALLGQRFDFSTLKPLGEPVTIGTDVFMDRATGQLGADLSTAGTLAYRSGGLVPVQFDWVDRTGRTVGTFGSPGTYINFDLSSDNTRVVAMRRPEAGNNVMWLLDDVRRTATAIADPSTGGLSDPTWSPDGQRIAYRRGSTTVIRGVFGGEERKVADVPSYPDSWSTDGRYLAAGRPNGPLYELWAMRVDGTREEIPLVQGLEVADEPRFSPDGKWVVYHATVNDSTQIYAIPFPPTGETFQISSDGGAQPRWRRDGRELFFLDLQGQLMSVDIPGGDPRKATVPRALFAAGVTTSRGNDQFAPSADGQRFLVRRPVGGTEYQTIHVVLNWRQLLQ